MRICDICERKDVRAVHSFTFKSKEVDCCQECWFVIENVVEGTVTDWSLTQKDLSKNVIEVGIKACRVIEQDEPIDMNGHWNCGRCNCSHRLYETAEACCRGR